MFKIPDMFHWIVVATGSKHIEDIYKAPESVLSNSGPIEEASSIFESSTIFKTAHRHTANSNSIYARPHHHR